jgi:uncharacterized repeat protein (TIGR02543 family)
VITLGIITIIASGGGGGGTDDNDDNNNTTLTYKVTYNANSANSGAVPADSTSYEQGDAVTVLGNTGNLAKIGYYFTGWNTTADGTGTSYSQGQTFTMGSVNVILYAKWEETSWTTKTSMPTARAELGVASVNDKIYAIGGISGSTLSTIEEYDPLTDLWEAKAFMPTARRLMVVAAVNNKIYVIGGIGGSDPNHITYTNVTEEYDPLNDEWTTKSIFPIEEAFNNVLGNQYIGGAAAGGKIYIVAYSAGGTTSQCPTYIYDPSNDTWDTGEPVPFTYTRYSVSSLNDTIYALGCYGLSSQSLKMAKYDPISDSWLLVASPNVERRNAQIVAANGKIYAVGGTSMEFDDVVSTIEEYDPSTDQWQEIESMPTARCSTGLVALDGDIYVIGGSESPSDSVISPLDTVEARSGG